MAGDQIMHAQPEVLGISEKFLDTRWISIDEKHISLIMFSFFLAIDETNNYLNNKLWKLCAGPLFDTPKIGDKIYYFPQGHIEQAIFFLSYFKFLYHSTYVLICKTYSTIWWYYQLVASMDDELCQLKPIFDIPSKICCNVFSIKLKVCVFDYICFLFIKYRSCKMT